MLGSSIFISCTDKELDPKPLSPAEKISGLYNGTGKYLPGKIDLGNTINCTPPPINYETKYQTGSATITITTLTDSTVRIGMSSGPFPQDFYDNIVVKEKGNLIEFYSGQFDINTSSVTFTGIAPNYGYSYSKNCKTGLPFYTSVLLLGPTNNPEYYNETIKRYEFSGIKKQ